MTRPVFGDAETIRKIDPFRKLLDEGIAIPREAVKCPFSDDQLAVTFNDTWVKGDEFGAGEIEVCFLNGDTWTPFWVADIPVPEEFWWVGGGYDKLVDRIVRWIQSQYPTFKHEC